MNQLPTSKNQKNEKILGAHEMLAYSDRCPQYNDLLHLSVSSSKLIHVMSCECKTEENETARNPSSSHPTYHNNQQ